MIFLEEVRGLVEESLWYLGVTPMEHTATYGAHSTGNETTAILMSIVL